MTAHQDAYDESQGKPNLEVLQYLQDNWGKDEINASVRVAKVVVASGTAGITATIPQGAEIFEVLAICTGSNGSGSMTVKDGDDNDITDAIACATDKAIDRAATIDDDYNIVGSSGVKVVANGAGDLGTVYITYKK